MQETKKPKIINYVKKTNNVRLSNTQEVKSFFSIFQAKTKELEGFPILKIFGLASSTTGIIGFIAATILICINKCKEKDCSIDVKKLTLIQWSIFASIFFCVLGTSAFTYYNQNYNQKNPDTKLTDVEEVNKVELSQEK